MTDVDAGFSAPERRLFRQRKVLPAFLAGTALVGSAMAATGYAGLGLTVLIGFLLLVFGIGSFATEHATRLERFDELLGDERMKRIGVLRFMRRLLRFFVYGAVVALTWLPMLRGDLPLIFSVFLAGAGAGLYANVLFHREIALIQPVVDLST